MGVFKNAWELVIGLDPDLYAIISLSLRVSLSAVALALLIGAPLGAMLATRAVPAKRALLVLSNAMMALPPVVVGLAIYLLLSRAGPLGNFGLLFTPSAMILAQTVLVLPIILSLTFEAVQPLRREYAPLMAALDVPHFIQMRTLLWDARFGVATAILAGFGRAIAEVGAVIIVGGNINGVTRVMTTSIALETSKGNLELALALGVVLVSIAVAVNVVMHALAQFGRRYQEAR